jgi:hypothetical protein
MAESQATSPEDQPSSSPAISDSAIATASESVVVEWDEGQIVVTVTPPPNSERVYTDSNQDSLLTALQQDVETEEVASVKVVAALPEEVVFEPVAGEELEFDQHRGSQLIWFIGLGSLILLVTGLIRRFSGR